MGIPARGEDGFSLIEVVVAGFVLMVVAAAVLSGLSSASRASGSTRARATAASLAVQDQERMRAMAPQQLASFEQVQTTKVGGVVYTVTSNGIPSATTSSSGCTAGGKGYVQIVSSVDWPSRGSLKPARIESLVARPYSSSTEGTGSALLVVRNAAGARVAGIPVGLSGSGLSPVVTDADGCAFFPTVAPGSYAFELSRLGWVDRNGTERVSVPVGVAAQQLAAAETTVDEAARVALDPVAGDRVWTRRPGSATPVRSSASSVRYEHAGMEAGSQTFPTSSSPHAPFFPFPTAYKVFTGACSANGELPDAAFDAALRPAFTRQVQLAPGSLSPPIRLFQPSLDLKVYVNIPETGNQDMLLSGARVFFTPKDPGCGSATLPARLTGADGRLADPGLPFGAYDVCVDATGAAWGRPDLMGRLALPDQRNDTIAGRDIPARLQPSAQLCQ